MDGLIILVPIAALIALGAAGLVVRAIMAAPTGDARMVEISDAVRQGAGASAYIDAQAYSSAEFQHGPIAVVDAGDPLLLLGTEDASLEGNEAVASRLREVGADLTVLAGAPSLLRHASAAAALPEGMHEVTATFVLVVAGQVLAERLATSRGIDPDAPRHLRKVTRTR